MILAGFLTRVLFSRGTMKGKGTQRVMAVSGITLREITAGPASDGDRDNASTQEKCKEMLLHCIILLLYSLSPLIPQQADFEGYESEFCSSGRQDVDNPETATLL